jgi:hypothetical protein
LKRDVTDILRRAFESTIANWPLIAIRIAENIVFVMIIVASIVATIVPVAVSAGVSNWDFKHADEPAQAIAAFIVEHLPLIAWILVVASIVLLVILAIHSFVEAGSARVFVDAERAAGPAGTRPAFRVFNMERWMQGGRASWTTVFWIYNIVWGLGGLILLIPLILTLAAMPLASDVGPRIAIACGGLALTFVVLIPVAIAMAVLSQKAIAVAVARSTSARESIRAGWTEMRRDFGRHFAVAFLVIAISVGGAMAISTLAAPMRFAHSIGTAPFTSILFAPGQIISSFAQSVFSAAVGLWFLAAYIGLTEEK